MLTFAGNIDSLVADGKSDIGHIAVNASGDVFSVTVALVTHGSRSTTQMVSNNGVSQPRSLVMHSLPQHLTEGCT